jgi:hypothetical protein
VVNLFFPHSNKFKTQNKITRMKRILLSSFSLLIAGAAFAQNNVTTGGQRYVLIEDVTGAWCQFCPDGTVKQEQVLAAEPKAIGTALHNADKMTFPDGNVVMASPNLVGGYPGGLVDRKRWPGYQSSGYPTTHVNRTSWATVAAQVVSTTPTWDVSLSHSYIAATRTVSVTVTAKSRIAQTGNFNVNAWIIEDSVIGPNLTGYNQVNYYNTQSGHPYYQAGSPIVGFVHRHVERAYLGGTWGTTGVIPANAPMNGTYSKTYTYVIPGKYDSVSTGAPVVNLNRISIIGMVMRDTTSKSDREILNSIQAKLKTSPNSVENLPALNNLSIYPNPAQDVVTVKGILNTPSDVTVAIINTLGQTVLEKSYHYTSSYFGESISIESLTNGVYFMNITTATGEKTSEKLIVNK